MSGSWACTAMGKPKSLGRSPLISRHVSPASSLRITSQCFCMNNVAGRAGCISTWCTQKPTSGSSSGSVPCDRSPRLTGRQAAPPSSLRNVPAAEIATNIRPACSGSRMIVCRHIPPAPGCQPGPDSCVRSPVSSVQVAPPSPVRNSAASSTPA